MSWTLAHFRIAELGCLASIPLSKWRKFRFWNWEMNTRIWGFRVYIFSRTMPLAWEEPANGFFHSLPRWDFLYDLSAHLCLRRCDFSLRPAPIPCVFLQIQSLWANNLTMKKPYTVIKLLNSFSDFDHIESSKKYTHVKLCIHSPHMYINMKSKPVSDLLDLNTISNHNNKQK